MKIYVKIHLKVCIKSSNKIHCIIKLHFKIIMIKFMSFYNEI